MLTLGHIRKDPLMLVSFSGSSQGRHTVQSYLLLQYRRNRILLVTGTRIPLLHEQASRSRNSQRVEYDGDGPIPLQLVVGVVTSAHLAPDTLDRVVTPHGTHTLKPHGLQSPGGSNAWTETKSVAGQQDLQKQHT